MLIRDAIDISPENLRAALPRARLLLPAKWLEAQKRKRPATPLLYENLPLASQGQVGRALREGLPQNDSMHPLAEAILGAEKVLAHFDAKGEFLADTFAFQVLSLSDVAQHLDDVKNMRGRLARLTGDQWRSTLYELLVASAQVHLGEVELLDETGEAVPDIAVNGSIYLECKAKTQYEQKVIDFIGRVKRHALEGVFQEATKIGHGLLIEIDVHDEAGIARIPSLLRSMFAGGITRRSTVRERVKVVAFQPGPFYLPHPMQAHSAEFWRWLTGFDGWNEWHMVQPYAEFMIENVSNMITTNVRRPILVCVRSTALSKSTQNIRTTIANACRRQLKAHQPGIVRVLVNSRLHGIGPNADPATIKEKLDTLSIELLGDYSRLAAIRFDIVTPPNFGEHTVRYTSAGAARRIEGAHAEAIATSPGVALL